MLIESTLTTVIANKSQKEKHEIHSSKVDKFWNVVLDNAFTTYQQCKISHLVRILELRNHHHHVWMYRSETSAAAVICPFMK